MTNGVMDFNITYNLSPMFYSVYPKNGIRKIYGMTGKKAVFYLANMRLHMTDNERLMRDMAPKNGWGTYDGAIEFIDSMTIASLRYPKLVWQGD